MLKRRIEINLSQEPQTGMLRKVSEIAVSREKGNLVIDAELSKQGVRKIGFHSQTPQFGPRLSCPNPKQRFEFKSRQSHEILLQFWLDRMIAQ